MELRPMRSDDLFKVAEIERRVFSDPWSAEAFKAGLSAGNQLYLVLDDEGNIAGYCGAMFVLDECEILNIAVDDVYRRNGLATLMLEAVIGLAIENGIKKFTLEVRDSNTPARSLYEKCGFVKVGVRRGYYTSPKEDAILMDLDAEDPEVIKRFKDSEEE